MNDIKGKIEKEANALRREVRQKTLGYITAGLGLVAGLAWNDAIRALIEYFFPLKENSMLIKFLYAAFLTLLIVVVGTYLSRILNKEEGTDDQS